MAVNSNYSLGEMELKIYVLDKEIKWKYTLFIQRFHKNREMKNLRVK